MENLRPIKFRKAMVEALWHNRKTQTRRVIKPQPPPYAEGRAIWNIHEDLWGIVSGNEMCKVCRSEDTIRCPYGKEGDILWVKEAWRIVDGGHGLCVEYEVGDTVLGILDKALLSKWHISSDLCNDLHTMPLWASRFRLEITKVRVELLQDITELDCCAEGMGSPITRDCKKPKFQEFWDSIYTDPNCELLEYEWGRNPWVWVVEFRVIEGGQK
jgi:hypothetical protein